MKQVDLDSLWRRIEGDSALSDEEELRQVFSELRDLRERVPQLVAEAYQKGWEAMRQEAIKALEKKT